MKNESSVRTQIAVSLLPRLNSHICLPLLERCGGIEGFFLESSSALNALYQEFNIPRDFFDRRTALLEADREWEQIDKYDIRLCSIEHSFYPPLLKHCEDAPIVFFYKGNIKAEAKTTYLAIVGTRHSSIRYQNRVESVISELHEGGCSPIIVSGLALGIDGSAHRASLKHHFRTFAVLGHGLHMIYPASHKNLAQSILAAEGALISEFPCTVTTHPSNFLRRNRIIAGLCQGTLIAESALKGGAMVTARLAQGYNREVMAFPGRPDDSYSAGCNRLIKENIAALVENGTDIAGILNLDMKKNTDRPLTLDLFEPSEKEKQLLTVIEENDEIHIDDLCRLTAFSQGELSALLLQLELEGKILALPGKRYHLK